MWTNKISVNVSVTDVVPENQILIFDKMMIDHYVDDKTPGTSFPDTIRANPIVLVSWIILLWIKSFIKESMNRFWTAKWKP